MLRITPWWTKTEAPDVVQAQVEQVGGADGVAEHCMERPWWLHMLLKTAHEAGQRISDHWHALRRGRQTRVSAC